MVYFGKMKTRKTLSAMAVALSAAAISCAFAPRVFADVAAATAAGVDLKVAWCESTGAQYVDTGIIAKPRIRVEAQLQWMVRGGDKCLIGARKDSNHTRFNLIYCDGDYVCAAPGHFSNSSGTSANGTAYLNSHIPTKWQLGKDYTVVSDFDATVQSVTVNGMEVMNLKDTPCDTGRTLYIFGVNNYGTFALPSTVRLYSMKIWSDGTLVRDYHPARQGTVYGLWEDTQGVFCPSATATPFAAAPAVDFNVPYCESTGAQYIDTGVVGRPRTKTEIVLSCMDAASDACVLGCRKDDNATRFCPVWFDQWYFYADPHTYYRIGTPRAVAGSQYHVWTDFDASNQSFALSQDGGTAATRNFTGTSVDTGRNMYLFAANWKGVLGYFSKIHLHSLKIWQDEALVRDYRPARIGTSYGVWDEVENRFSISVTDTGFFGAHVVDGEPDYYAQWIESTDSTYIDSGVVGRPETKVEASFQWREVSAARLVGSRYYDSFAVSSGSDGAMTFATHAGAVTLEDGVYAADTDYTVVADVHAASQTYSVTGPSGTITSNTVQTLSTTTNSWPLFIFGRGTNNCARARLYAMKIWQDGTLVRDFVPGIKDGEGCLYDRVGGKCHFSYNGSIIPAAGLVGPPVGTPSVPRYALSYLGSHGNAFVDTGVIGRPHTRIEAAFQWTVLGADKCFIGARKSSGETRFNPIYADNGYLCCSPSYFKSSAYSGGCTPTELAVGTDYTIVADMALSNQTVTVDGTTVMSLSETAADTEIPMYLFASHYGYGSAPATLFASARVRALKIWQDGSLVRDYVPVIADNGGPYLYDKVTKTFHQGEEAGLWDVGEVGPRINTGASVIIR